MKPIVLALNRLRARFIHSIMTRVSPTIVHRERENGASFNTWNNIEIVYMEPRFKADVIESIQSISSCRNGLLAANQLKCVVEMKRFMKWKNFCDGFVYLDVQGNYSKLDLCREFLKAGIECYMYSELKRPEILVNDRSARILCYQMIADALDELGDKFVLLERRYREWLNEQGCSPP